MAGGVVAAMVAEPREGHCPVEQKKSDNRWASISNL